MKNHLDQLLERYPALVPCRSDIFKAFRLLRATFQDEGKLLLCGNGGSCSDAGHIAGELMKGFMRKRSLDPGLKEKLLRADDMHGPTLADKLQRGLPAIPLSGSDALASAISNDIDSDLVYAQQVLGMGKPGDALMAISTSGNSANVCRAVSVAHALGMKAVGLTGGDGGWLAKHCDVCICVPGRMVPVIQELHLPVYHCLCRMLEDEFFMPATAGGALTQ